MALPAAAVCLDVATGPSWRCKEALAIAGDRAAWRPGCAGCGRNRDILSRLNGGEAERRLSRVCSVRLIAV
jgi:hypothetical protein